MWLGRRDRGGVGALESFGIGGEVAVSALAVVAVALATAVLLSERDLSSRWGANFLSGGTDSAAMIRKQELADRCDEIARTYKLSAREEEVLLLLAQRKTVGIIERELLIANGTREGPRAPYLPEARHPHASGALRSARPRWPRDGAPGLGRHTQGRRTGMRALQSREAYLVAFHE